MNELFKKGDIVITKVPNTADGLTVILVSEHMEASKPSFSGVVLQYLGGSLKSNPVGLYMQHWNFEKFTLCNAEIIIKVKSK